MTTIAVVDYGMGNLRSVAKALEHVAPDASVIISSDPDDLRSADRVVLPGQGAMPDCMRHLDESGLRPALLEAARNKPLFGVCVGEQMLFDRSDEGDTPGLGWLPGEVVRFPASAMTVVTGRLVPTFTCEKVPVTWLVRLTVSPAITPAKVAPLTVAVAVLSYSL